MIGNLRNMAIDMGSELENQNRQLERINLKVNAVVFARISLISVVLTYSQIGVSRCGVLILNKVEAFAV